QTRSEVMELLLIATYTAICYAVFKIFRIPVNKWTVPTAVLGGIFMIAAILLVMNYNHPFTATARIYFATTPIMPAVKGRVIEVPVKPNTPLKEGDVLFRLDPRPYQYVVDQRKAMLAEAEQTVKQLKAALDKAQAAVERVKSQVSLAQIEYDRQSTLVEKKVVAQTVLDVATRNLDAAKQAFSESEAAAESARLAYESEIAGVNTTVARVQAELGDAQYDLDQTVMRAPGPGYVTQMALRPGMYVVPAPLRPVMVFIHTDDEELAAGFQQNSLQRIRAGDEAEIAFDALPGQIVKGKVKHVIDAIATGQLQATGVLQDVGGDIPGGRAVAIIDIEEDTSAYNLPGGAEAQVAVYTPFAHHFAIIRRILLRMKSWQNFVFLEGH
ncbi:MAG: HlyD family secretion protein, partial [Methyloceanibacter sp.]